MKAWSWFFFLFVGAVLIVKANKSLIIVNICSVLSSFTILSVSFSYQ